MMFQKDYTGSNQLPIIITACAINLLAVSAVFMTQPIFIEISEYFNIEITQARLSFSVVSLSYAVSFIFIGPASDKYNLLMMALVGLFLLALSILFASHTTQFMWFVTAMSLTGFFAAFVPASMFPYVAAIAPSEKVGLYMGSIVASGTFGVIFGRVAMGLLTTLFGWELSFKIFAFLVFILWLLALFVLGRNSDQKESSNKNKSLIGLYKISIKQLLNFNILSILAAGFSLFFGFLGMVTFLTYRLADSPFNFSAGQIGWISFAGITALIAPFSGNTSKKTGIFKIIFPSLLMCLFSFQLMGWFESILMITAGLLLLFLSVYSCQPLLFLMIGENVSKETLGAASSLYILFCIGGGSLSSIFLGSVWDTYGWAGITIICSIFVIISILFMLIVKKRIDSFDGKKGLNPI